MTRNFVTTSVEETIALGRKLGKVLRPGDVVALDGDLGAGKTVITRGITEGLGLISEDVCSPTFTIVNEYDGDLPLFHFDMYRLSNSDALFDIGWDDYLDRNGVCAVEWSENVLDAMPENTIFIDIVRHPENENWRIITVSGGIDL